MKFITAKQISKKSKSSFYYTFNLLPKIKRDAMNIVYAFCRKTDDIVDNDMPSEIKLKNLRQWKDEFDLSVKSKSSHKLLNQLAEVVSYFNIPLKHFYDLLKGMEMDIEFNRYESFEMLKEYCYRVASTVGLISIEIFGYKNQKSRDFAVELGIALQLTNILRDVKNDLEAGRVYIPINEMKRFNYSEVDLFSKVYNDSFVNLMKFQIQRAEQYFQSASKLLPDEDKNTLFPARAMQSIYYRILQQIKKNNCNVFEKNYKLSNLEKLFISLKVWLGSRIAF
jgi:phytoene synthase